VFPLELIIIEDSEAAGYRLRVAGDPGNEKRMDSALL